MGVIISLNQNNLIMEVNNNKEIMLNSIKVEIISLTDMFQNITKKCFSKCVKTISYEELILKEAFCIDRCIQKYVESYSLTKLQIQKFMENKRKQQELRTKIER